MRASIRHPFLVLGLLCLAAVFPACLAYAQTKPPTATTATPPVTPINWRLFRRPAPQDAEYQAGRRILLNNAHHNLQWITETYKRDAARKMYLVTQTDEQGTRRPASAVYGLAVLLKTNNYDAASVGGVSPSEAVTRTVELIKGIAANHVANQTDSTKPHWGNQWQSALWAALLGHAGWLLWDDLDSDTQAMIARLVEHEANRFIAPGYKVPYWANPDGHINTPGDTKAEENAWNACLLQLALAMMPHHPHFDRWREVANELMISSFALQKDVQTNTTRVEGRTVKDWLHGYNVRDDGAVINHNRLHPDYMSTPTMSLRTYLVQPLAGQKPYKTSLLNADFIYRVFVTTAWPSPPNKAPGGTIYQTGQAEVYYPTGTDWSPHRLDIFYIYDVFAQTLKLDTDLPKGKHGQDWAKLRAERMLAMQARFPDGRMFAPGEYESYPGREQMVGWQIGDVLLLRWLQAQKAF